MNNQPNDRLARGTDFEFQADTDSASIKVAYPNPGSSDGKLVQTLYRNALLQMAHTADLRSSF